MVPQLDLSTLKPATSLDRKILNESDLDSWKQSLPFEWVQEYIQELIESTALGQGDSEDSPDDSNNVAINQLLTFLSAVSSCVTSAPPSSPPFTPSENFKSFRSRLSQLSTSLHIQLLPSLLRADVILPELDFHLNRSFGSTSRMDYGTGHELSFILYLLILRLTGILSQSSSRSIVTKILSKYWEVSKEVRDKFGLVQAGRRGGWKKDQETGTISFDHQASEARAGHPTRSNSTSSSLHLNTSSSPSNLLRSLLLPSSSTPSNTSTPDHSGTSTPLKHHYEKETRSDLFQLYVHTTLISIPCLLHLRFGSILPFLSSKSPHHSKLPSSSDRFPDTPSNVFDQNVQLKGGGEEEDERLEDVQNRRVGSEGTVAPWNVPSLAGQEHLGASQEGGGNGQEGGERRPSPLLKRGRSRLSISELVD
ncbi:hypothetical protein JCM16303_002665 [Sporobolomyces ruberrimus]